MTTIIEKIVETWPNRAAVRNDAALREVQWEAERPDYPIEMLPFHRHPTFVALDDHKKRAILTLAWLVYNERVVTAEEFVANPALMMMSQTTIRGADELAIRTAIQQTLVDEHFHTLMHMRAMDTTRRMRGDVRRDLRFPDSVTYRRLLALKDEHPDKADSDLLTLVWAIVAEISVNAYLSLLSTNTDIQPMHRIVPYLHNRDEFAHSSIFIEISKLLYLRMSEREKSLFNEFLPEALRAFFAQDYSAWKVILHEVGVDGYEEMLHDCAADPGFKMLSRDFSGIRDLVDELNIREKVNYEFQ